MPLGRRLLAAALGVALLAAPATAREGDAPKVAPPRAKYGPVAIEALRIIPVVGEPIDHGIILVKDGKILALGKASEITITARGAKIAGTTKLPALGSGERRAFDVELTDVQDSVTLVVAHRKGGTFELPVLRKRVATIPIKKRADYVIEAGYQTEPDQAHGARGQQPPSDLFQIPLFIHGVHSQSLFTVPPGRRCPVR